MLRSILSAAAVLWLASAGVEVAAGNGPALQAPAARNVARAPVAFSPTIHGLEQARAGSDGAVIASSRISGTGTVQADHVIVEDVLSPGHSPGCIDFGGNVTFSFSATLQTEIGGATPCSEHDQIRVANTLTLNSPTLEVVLINGFPPQYGDRFDVLDWGTLIGAFGTINTSAAALTYPLAWDSSQLYLTGELIVSVQAIADGDLAPWNAPDSQINAADVLIASQLVLGQRTTGPLQLAHGDMNLDGIVDLADLLLIQQLVLP